MRTTLIAAFAACFAIMLLISPKPAVSLPAAAALHHGQTDTGIVQEVEKKYRYGYRRYPHYRGYAYRPYYRPHGYYGYGYPYWRRPGFSIWLGF